MWDATLYAVDGMVMLCVVLLVKAAVDAGLERMCKRSR